MEEKPKMIINSAEKSSNIYPKRLRSLSSMPDMLYYIGRLPDDDRPTAAIVGARMCSPYGRIQAFQYGKFLSENGVQVISGMAAGIDAEGHKGALEGGTPTFAVLGNGVTGGSRRKMEGLSVNTSRGHRVWHIIFLQGTGSSADWQMW